MAGLQRRAGRQPGHLHFLPAPARCGARCALQRLLLHITMDCRCFCKVISFRTGQMAVALHLPRSEPACCRPAGWGYAASAVALQAATAAKHPADDGLWLMDTQSGTALLLVSLQALFQATFSGDFPFPQRVVVRMCIL